MKTFKLPSQLICRAPESSFSVQVEILYVVPGSYSEFDTLIPGKYVQVVPIMVDCKSQHQPIKSWELVKQNGTQFTNVKYRSHGYDLGSILNHPIDKINFITSDSFCFSISQLCMPHQTSPINHFMLFLFLVMSIAYSAPSSVHYRFKTLFWN
jgi:hypothetical protein